MPADKRLYPLLQGFGRSAIDDWTYFSLGPQRLFTLGLRVAGLTRLCPICRRLAGNNPPWRRTPHERSQLVRRAGSRRATATPLPLPPML